MMRYTLVWFIMVGVVVWSLVNALGAIYSGHNLYRGLMIGGFSAAFLAFWGILLYVNRAKWQRD